jgi:arylsulfatase A-like enzyme/HEAT repeat protein
MGRARRAILAGFLGGLLAGAFDALATATASADVLAWGNRLHLLVIECGLGALAGSALAMVFIGWSIGLERLLGRSRWLSGTHAVALLLGAPLVIYDAFSMFQGAQAKRIPAHGAISITLILVGAGALWGAATVWSWLLERAEPDQRRDGQPSGRRGTLLLAGLALALAALAGSWANHHVLPRLYRWFHLSLTLVGLVLCVLAVRLWLGISRRSLGKKWSWTLAVVAAASLLAGVMLERPALSRSQGLRFYVFEKTQLASLFARLLPARRASAAIDTGEVPADALPRLSSGPHLADADIVLITVDALRADHLSCYGYARPTSPNIDAIAARGVRFAHAYAQAPHTSFSLASIMIGKYYPTLARLSSSDTHETLAKILRRYGWKTAAFFPPAVFYIDAQKMKAFEANYFDFEYVKYEYLGAEQRVAQIRDFLDAEHPKKLFLWLHLFEPHEPYESHAEFDFGHRDVDRYDSEISYTDVAVGKVVKLIQSKRPNAIVFIGADHGEEFGEHDGRYHGTTLFEEQVHVPFIVAGKGLPARVVDGPAQLIDIPATILGLLDIPIPERMRGTDLGPWLATPPAPIDDMPPAFAEVDDKRMVATADDKLICDMAKDFCSLYDLHADPGERHNLADQRPDRVAALRRKLDAWLGQQARYEHKLLGAANGRGEIARTIERGRLGDPGAALPLAQLLRADLPVAARREAASLLVTALPARPETKAELLAAVNGADDPTVRDWAAVAAARLGERSVQARLRTLVSTPSTEATFPLHVRAALALAKNGDATGVPVLIELLDTCGMDVSLCKRVLSALGTLKDGRAVEPLMEHLAYVQTRYATAEALANIADPRSESTLIDCLESDVYVPVRAIAATGLGRIGGARSLQALRSSLKHEREELVLSAVHDALAAHNR